MHHLLKLSLAALVVILSGCTSPSEAIAEGDRLRDEKRYDEALDRYREALNRSDLTGADRERAFRARGETQLAKGDLVGAEASFKQLPPSSSSRAALLGHVAYARRDTAQAETFYREAFTRGERGLVTVRLAEIVGGEAETSRRLGEAAGFLRDGGGDPALAQALDDGAAAWAASDRGEAPAGLVARVEAARAAARGYVSIELLRADLLERSGDREKAKAAYVALASFEPKPSEGFMKRVRAREARRILESGDASVLRNALESGLLLPEEAAAVRADLARGREAQGDPAGALDLWRESVKASGAHAARAWCEVARLETARGKLDAAVEAWQQAEAARAEADAPTRALLALAGAATGDPLGARKALEAAVADATLDSDLRARSRRALGGVERLRLALEAFGRRDFGRAARLARSAVAEVPSWRPAVELEAVASVLATGGGPESPGALRTAVQGLEAGGARGETADAFAFARTAALVDAALFDEATAGVAKAPVPALAAIVGRGPDALLRLLEAGKVEDAATLFEKLKERGLLEPAGELCGRARGDAAFAGLWSSKRFVAVAGGPDPLARPAPYAAEATLSNGVVLGVVRVVAAGEQGLQVLVPGRPEPVAIPRERLGPRSLRGVADAAFERACQAVRELGSRPRSNPAGEER